MPAYLRAVSILEPFGNITAEVGSAVDLMMRGISPHSGAKLFSRKVLMLAASFGIATTLVFLLSERHSHEKEGQVPEPAIRSVQQDRPTVQSGASDQPSVSNVAQTSRSNDRLNLVVVGEDADLDTVPRSSRIFNRVIAALSEELNLKGFSVIDETIASMGFTDPGRARRRDTELIDVARSIARPPIDIIVVMNIYASVRKSAVSDITRPEVRIPGRIINVRTGQLLGTYEVRGLELPPLPRACDRECVLEHVGDQSRVLAHDLGLALSEKLDAMGVTSNARPNVSPENCEGFQRSFTLSFENFTNQQITKIEEYISAFKCFTAIRPNRASASLIEFTYNTTGDSARLLRNVRVMLDQMGVASQVQFSEDVIKVVRIGTR
jgi:hypothetical protein